MPVVPQKTDKKLVVNFTELYPAVGNGRKILICCGKEINCLFYHRENARRFQCVMTSLTRLHNPEWVTKP